MKYRAEIDGLRALAVLPVILFHAGFEWFNGGFVGVDVFFVISGYLITSIIISEMSKGKFSVVDFYERRARRILPALFFVMLISSCFGVLILSSTQLKDFGESLVALSFFSSNFLFWMESDYFDNASELKPLLHTWSLALEEQFYILFPIFITLTWRFGVRWILAFLALVFLMSLIYSQWAVYNSPISAFYLLPARAWELLAGVFVAFYLKNRSHFKSHAVNQCLSLIGMVMIVYSMITFDETIPFPGLYALLPIMGTVLLILCALPNTFSHGFLNFRPIVGIGLISYSAYLWHHPLLVFARYLNKEEIGTNLLISICVFSFVLAWMSWRVIEKPYRDRAQITRKKLFTHSILGILIFTSLGFFIFKADGVLSGFHSKNPSIQNNYEDTSMFFSYIQDNFRYCSRSDLTADPRFYNGSKRCYASSNSNPKNVLFGDSHAEDLFIGLADFAPSTYLTVRGGYPFIGEEGFDLLINTIINNKELETVIYAAKWDKIYRDLGAHNFKVALVKTLDTFIASDKKILIALDVPHFSFKATDCYYKSLLVEKNVCSFSYEDFFNQRRSF